MSFNLHKINQEIMKFIYDNLCQKHLFFMKKLFTLKYFMISYKFKTSRAYCSNEFLILFDLHIKYIQCIEFFLIINYKESISI